MRAGYIPVLFVRGDNLPQAWERAILAVWENGVDVRTEYDKKDDKGSYIDPPSKDATLGVEVVDPFGEPRIHKNFPGGPAELEIYRQEVVKGIHDHWIDPTNPTKWTYTYHQRLFSYEAVEDLKDPNAQRLGAVNQVEGMVNRLLHSHFTRRAQSITWIPNADPKPEDPPCLQRVWCRILIDEMGVAFLNMNAHWRSRDGYKAWFMNSFALTDLQRRIAEEISQRMKREVRVGRYFDLSDSFHLYGSYFKEIEQEVEKMRKEPDYRKRSWRSDDPKVKLIFEETRERLRENPDFQRLDRGPG